MNGTTLERLGRLIGEAAKLSADETADLDGPTPLYEDGLNLDSVTVLELLLAAEKEFDVELDPDSLNRAGALQTLQSLAGFIDTCLSEQSDAE